MADEVTIMVKVDPSKETVIKPFADDLAERTARVRDVEVTGTTSVRPPDGVDVDVDVPF
jgi:hypothetical protein